jgi:hypothetical protein
MKASLKSLVNGGGSNKAAIAAVTATLPEPQPTPESTYRKAQTRTNTRQIAGHFQAEVAQALRMLAAEQDKDNQELLAEALNMLFTRYGKPVTVEAESGRRKKD